MCVCASFVTLLIMPSKAKETLYRIGMEDNQMIFIDNTYEISWANFLPILEFSFKINTIFGIVCRLPDYAIELTLQRCKWVVSS